jgi:hypothetical protein
MASRRRKAHRKRIQHPAVTYYKFAVYLVLVVVVGAFIYRISAPVFQNTADVLGISTLLAKGGPPDNPGRGQGGPKSDTSQTPENSGSGTGQGNAGVKLEERPGRGGLRSDTAELRENPRNLELRALDTDSGDGSDGQVTVATDGGGLVMPEKHLGARIHFPHTIDLATNSLIITTPAGTKTVAILPDKAIQNMITKGIISKIGGHVINASGSAIPGGDDSATGSGDVGDATDSGGFTVTQEDSEEAIEDTTENISLTEESGQLVYKIKGTLKQKFLGVLPVDLEREVTVSAESGDVTNIHEPLFTRFLNAVSF